MLQAGNINVVAGQQFSAFQDMVEFEKARKHQELILICNEQIKTVPEWLTPYLYRGIANANLGQRADAIKDIKYVINSAPEDPEYSQAEELLKKLSGD